MEPSQVGRKAGEATVKYILRLCAQGGEKLGKVFGLLEGILCKEVSAAFLILIGSSLSKFGLVFLNTYPPTLLWWGGKAAMSVFGSAK